MDCNKKCVKCQEDKPRNSFSKNSKRADTLQSFCRGCSSLYFHSNKHKYDTKRREYRKRTRNLKAEYDLKYRNDNAENIRNLKRVWVFRHKNEPLFKLKRNMRRRLHHLLKGKLKPEKTFDLIGCDAETLKIHLENKFRPGMAWDNYGEWHVDHIIPCCAFNLEIPEQLKRCFHYSNTQPLWAADNLRKSYIYEGVSCRISELNQSPDNPQSS